jgi:hypothetical protein
LFGSKYQVAASPQLARSLLHDKFFAVSGSKCDSGLVMSKSEKIHLKLSKETAKNSFNFTLKFRINF